MWKSLRDIRSWFVPVPDDGLDAHIEAGLYHFHREIDGEHIRYHLRVDEDGPAILIAAASEALLMSPAGARIAKALLEGKSPDAVQRELAIDSHTNVVAEVAQSLEDLGRSSERYPIFNLVDPAVMERRWRLSAPFQADVEVSSSSTAREIIKRLWSIRVPHARLIVTPRTDRQGLVDLVVFAEDLGMIAGVRANSLSWYRGETIRNLAAAGLDYMVFPYLVDSQWHDRLCGHGDYLQAAEMIRDIRSFEMTPVATLPLIPAWNDALSTSLDRLQAHGVHHVELFAIAEERGPLPGLPEDRITGTASPSHSPPHHSAERGFFPHELPQLASWIEDLADSRRMQLVWLPPHARSDGTSLSQVMRGGARASGDVSVRIDRNGNVIPPRGPHRSAGNLLVDPWSDIWNDEAFRRYRGRVAANTRCPQCPGLAICAADCPTETVSWVLS